MTLTIPAAVEESLRYISAVRTTGRLATTDQVIDGILFPAGSTVLLGLHAGGLSEAEEQGFEFNIFRESGCPHLALGPEPITALAPHLLALSYKKP